MSEEEIFFAAIAANRLDDATRLAYADWLLEQGEDDKSAYIRMEYQMRMAKARLDELSHTVDQEWLSRIAGMASVVLLGYPITHKINAIKIIREVSGVGLAEAKQMSESLPCVIRTNVPLPEATAIVKQFTTASIDAEVRYG